MILSTLQQLTADFCSDPSQTRFSDKYLAAINRAQEQFAMDSKALFKDTSYTAAVDDSTYDLPTDFLWEESVTYDGFPLKPISRHTLYTLYPGTDWTELEGTPKYYMVDPEQAVRTLRLVPIPQDALTISMRYYPLPAEVSGSTDVVLNSSSLMVQFHMGIAAFAAWLVLTFEEVTPAIVEKRRELMKIYQDAVNKGIETFGNTKSEPLRMRPK